MGKPAKKVLPQAKGRSKPSKSLVKNKPVAMKAKSKAQPKTKLAKGKAKIKIVNVKTKLSPDPGPGMAECELSDSEEDCSEIIIHKSYPKAKKDISKALAIPKANSRAKNSVPPKFTLKKSDIAEFGYGIFSKEEVPLGSWFGPYDGHRIPVEAITKEMDMSYMWEIMEDGEFKRVIDGHDENYSTWMRYINCARNDVEQNLCAFQYNNNIYYRSSKLILANSELLVWYGKDFIYELGTCIFDSEENIPTSRHEKFIKIVMETAKDPDDSSDDESDDNTYPHFVDIDALPVAQTNGDGLDVVKAEYVSSGDEEMIEPSLPRENPSLTKKISKKSKRSSSPKKNNNKVSKKRKSAGMDKKVVKIRLSTVVNNQVSKKRLSNDASNKGSKKRKSANTNSKEIVTHVSTDKSKKGKTNKSPGIKKTAVKTGKSIGVSNKSNKGKNSKSVVLNAKKVKSRLSADNSVKGGRKSKTPDMKSKEDKKKKGQKRKLSSPENTAIKSTKARKFTKIKDKNKKDPVEEETIDTSGVVLHKCTECQRILSNANSLRVHMRIHSEEKPFICEQCGSCFRQYSNLASHKVRHMTEKPHECTHCERRFYLAKQLEDHSRVHTGDKPYKCNLCEKSFGRYSSLNLHKKAHEDNKQHACEECDRKFDFPNQLKIHMRLHTDEKPYICEVCQKAFRRLGDVKLHKRTHTGEKPYECLDCGKKFTSSGDLSKHKRSHTGDRPYKCGQCGKCFMYSGNLASHQLIHTENKPHPCDQCDKKFRHASDLRTHQRIHTGDRPYKCDECGNTFNRQWLLTQHKRAHAGIKPYTCNECGKGFTYSSDLVKHAITHTGLRPFVCEKCRKTFTAAVSLRRHMMIHTGSRPHTCSFCGQRFRRKHHLDNHKKTYHTGGRIKIEIKKEGENTVQVKRYVTRQKGDRGDVMDENIWPPRQKSKLSMGKKRKLKSRNVTMTGKVISPYKKLSKQEGKEEENGQGIRLLKGEEDIWDFKEEDKEWKKNRTKIKRKSDPDVAEGTGKKVKKKIKFVDAKKSKIKSKKRKRISSENEVGGKKRKKKETDAFMFQEDGNDVTDKDKIDIDDKVKKKRKIGVKSKGKKAKVINRTKSKVKPKMKTTIAIKTSLSRETEIDTLGKKTEKQKDIVLQENRSDIIDKEKSTDTMQEDISDLTDKEKSTSIVQEGESDVTDKEKSTDIMVPEDASNVTDNDKIDIHDKVQKERKTGVKSKGKKTKIVNRTKSKVKPKMKTTIARKTSLSGETEIDTLGKKLEKPKDIVLQEHGSDIIDKEKSTDTVQEDISDLTDKEKSTDIIVQEGRSDVTDKEKSTVVVQEDISDVTAKEISTDIMVPEDGSNVIDKDKIDIDDKVQKTRKTGVKSKGKKTKIVSRTKSKVKPEMKTTVARKTSLSGETEIDALDKKLKALKDIVLQENRSDIIDKEKSTDIVQEDISDVTDKEMSTDIMVPEDGGDLTDKKKGIDEVQKDRSDLTDKEKSTDMVQEDRSDVTDQDKIINMVQERSDVADKEKCTDIVPEKRSDVTDKEKNTDMTQEERSDITDKEKSTDLIVQNVRIDITDKEKCTGMAKEERSDITNKGKCIDILQEDACDVTDKEKSDIVDELQDNDTIKAANIVRIEEVEKNVIHKNKENNERQKKSQNEREKEKIIVGVKSNVCIKEVADDNIVPCKSDSVVEESDNVTTMSEEVVDADMTQLESNDAAGGSRQGKYSIERENEAVLVYSKEVIDDSKAQLGKEKQLGKKQQLESDDTTGGSGQKAAEKNEMVNKKEQDQNKVVIATNAANYNKEATDESKLQCEDDNAVADDNKGLKGKQGKTQIIKDSGVIETATHDTSERVINDSVTQCKSNDLVLQNRNDSDNKTKLTSENQESDSIGKYSKKVIDVNCSGVDKAVNAKGGKVQIVQVAEAIDTAGHHSNDERVDENTAHGVDDNIVKEDKRESEEKNKVNAKDKIHQIQNDSIESGILDCREGVSDDSVVQCTSGNSLNKTPFDLDENTPIQENTDARSYNRNKKAADDSMAQSKGDDIVNKDDPKVVIEEAIDRDNYHHNKEKADDSMAKTNVNETLSNVPTRSEHQRSAAVVQHNIDHKNEAKTEKEVRYPVAEDSNKADKDSITDCETDVIVHKYRPDLDGKNKGFHEKEKVIDRGRHGFICRVVNGKVIQCEIDNGGKTDADNYIERQHQAEVEVKAKAKAKDKTGNEKVTEMKEDKQKDGASEIRPKICDENVVDSSMMECDIGQREMGNTSGCTHIAVQNERNNTKENNRNATEMETDDKERDSENELGMEIDKTIATKVSEQIFESDTKTAAGSNVSKEKCDESITRGSINIARADECSNRNTEDTIEKEYPDLQNQKRAVVGGTNEEMHVEGKCKDGLELKKTNEAVYRKENVVEKEKNEHVVKGEGSTIRGIKDKKDRLAFCIEHIATSKRKNGQKFEKEGIRDTVKKDSSKTMGKETITDNSYEIMHSTAEQKTGNDQNTVKGDSGKTEEVGGKGNTEKGEYKDNSNLIMERLGEVESNQVIGKDIYETKAKDCQKLAIKEIDNADNEFSKNDEKTNEKQLTVSSEDESQLLFVGDDNAEDNVYVVLMEVDGDEDEDPSRAETISISGDNES